MSEFPPRLGRKSKKCSSCTTIGTCRWVLRGIHSSIIICNFISFQYYRSSSLLHLLALGFLGTRTSSGTLHLYCRGTGSRERRERRQRLKLSDCSLPLLHLDPPFARSMLQQPLLLLQPLPERFHLLPRSFQPPRILILLDDSSIIQLGIRAG